MTIEIPAPGPIRPGAGGDGPMSWMDAALCAQVDPDVWFREDGQVSDAKKICASCPVQAACGAHVDMLEAQTPGDRRYGTWAGRAGMTRAKDSISAAGDSARDIRIMRMSGQGLDPKEIAAHVGCTDRTVHRVLRRHREAS